MRLQRTAFAALAAVIVAGVIGYVVGASIRSPADIAAQTAVPEPSLILHPAEARVLSTDVVTRGTARFGSGQDVSLAVSYFKEPFAIVTGLPESGKEIGQGEVLMTVAGRPVFLLEGQQPSYRDLGPSMIGDDVRQLEAALSSLGLDPGTVDGAYDDRTGDAVATLYRGAGHEPVVATDSQLEAIRPLYADLVAGARAGAGIQVPADEIVFVASLPIRVSELAATLGQELTNPVMTITDAHVAVDGSLRVEEAQLVTTGMSVRIDEPDLGINATGVVSRVAEAPGTDGLDGFHVYFEVRVDGDPPAIVGASVRLTVPIATTEGAVLAVPVSALALAADGSTTIRKVVGTSVVVVTVDPGLSAAGFVQVTPIDGTLEPGDMVVIGLEPGPSPSG